SFSALVTSSTGDPTAIIAIDIIPRYHREVHDGSPGQRTAAPTNRHPRRLPRAAPHASAPNPDRSAEAMSEHEEHRHSDGSSTGSRTRSKEPPMKRRRAAAASPRTPFEVGGASASRAAGR